jgi:hypothetical protein
MVGTVFADVLLRSIYQCRINDVGIEVVLFGKIPIRRVLFSNIVEVRKISFKESLRSKYIFKALRFGIYGVGSGIVLIHLKEKITFPFPPDIFGKKNTFDFSR